MKIVNIQKANEYYGNLNDVNAINALKMKIYSVASIGATLLLTGLNLNHAMNIGTGEFINNGLSVVLPLASAYTGIYLNSAPLSPTVSHVPVNGFTTISLPNSPTSVIPPVFVPQLPFAFAWPTKCG